MKYQIKTKLVLILVIFGSVALSLILTYAKPNTETKVGQMLISEPVKNGSFFISANISQNDTISPVLKANFPFNAIYIKWQQADSSQNPEFNLYVRFLNENWGNWILMEPDDDYQGKDTAIAELSSQMIPTKLTDSFQYKLVFNNDEAKANLQSLKFSYLDTSKGPSGNFKIALDANDQNLKIISRAEWGADESLRFDSNGTNLWPEEYYTPQKFVIHHTAGEKANLDPRATVRAIYYYHAVERGWGDIGYNYLIDSKGNIYEGRFGGEATVGGHAYLRNRNTIGIAILGCYDTGLNEKKKADCNTPDNLTEATKQALNKLIAVKSQEFNIDPLGQSEFHGQILANVIGHRDVGSTTCPGNLIYDALPQTRQLAYNALIDLGGYKKPLPTGAQFVRLSASEINIEETKTADVYVEYKNTGQEPWRGYEDNYLYVSDTHLKNKIAKLDTFKIALASDKDEIPENQTAYPVFKLMGGNVYPGEIGKFKMTLSAPAQATETKKFVLAWQDKGYFPDTDFAITLNKIACNCQGTTTDQPIFKAGLIQSDLPTQLSAKQEQKVLLQFRNDGNQAWNKSMLKLQMISGNLDLKAATWADESGSFKPNEEIIYPNATATFEFSVQAPKNPGTIPLSFTLNYNDTKFFDLAQVIDILAPYAGQITKNTLPLTAKRNSRPKVTLTIKNTGTKTWTNPILKSTDIDGTNSWFKDWSWYDKKTIKKVKKTVKPGEEITFDFRLLAYWKTGKYPAIYKLWDAKTEIYLDGKSDFTMTAEVIK
ncbi:MAG: N-acetylmuramoyl-L-alanine amidase [Candidatus Parcubacteria bacterium]|nr:N-acetylmuramoyl-L-alanine amidase [Candidatus Parcubacteria bacterium]